MSKTKTDAQTILKDIPDVQANNEVIEADTKQELTTVDPEKVNQFKNEIVALDSTSVMNYGQDQQQQLSQFSDRMLKDVQNDDVANIGKTLDSLMKTLDESDPDKLLPENQNFITKALNRTKKEIKKYMGHMMSVSAKVDKVSKELEKNQGLLMKDVQSLDTLYQHNQAYFKEVSALVEAGQSRIEELRNNELAQLREKAGQTGAQEDVQAVADMEDFINRLDKRVYDLQLSRDVALQSAPQIRMIQNINQSLAENIQSSLMTSIPVWKNQMAIALSLVHQREISESQKRVNDTTNDIILKNSEMLKQNATRTAQENERAVINVETLSKTQDNIKEAIQKTIEIKQEGERKRKDAQKELSQLETQLYDQQMQTRQALDE